MRAASKLVVKVVLLCAFISGPAHAGVSITHIGAIGDKAGGSGTTQVTLTTTSDVAAGESIIVIFSIGPNINGLVSCTDSAGNVYHVDRDYGGVSMAVPARIVVFSTHNVSALASGGTITVTHDQAKARAISAFRASGLALSSILHGNCGGTPCAPSYLCALDQRHSTAGNSITPSTQLPYIFGGMTTLYADELLIGAIAVNGPFGEGFTPGLGWSSDAAWQAGTTGQGDVSNIALYPETQIVSSTGGYLANGQIGVARDWSAALVTYQIDTNEITVGATTDTQTGALRIGGPDQYLGGAFTFIRSGETADISQLILSETNSMDANANLSNIRIYYETAVTCTYDGNEILFGAASFDTSDQATLSAFASETVHYDSGENDYARAIAIDADGNIYVAGSHTNDFDWAVRKYDANGSLDTTWGTNGMVTYDSDINDSARAIAVDANNNIYVAGYHLTNGQSWGIRKYDANGVLCDTGNVTCGGWGDADSGMITYDSGIGADQAHAIAIDGDTSIYVAGYQGTGVNDWAVRKYDANGDLDTTWGDVVTPGMVIYDSGFTDQAQAITIDVDKNVYVAGYQGTGGNDWAVRKYDASGGLETTWGDVATPGMVTYNSGATQFDRAYAIAIDTDKNIYVAGYHEGTTGRDWAVRKYDANGVLDTTWGDAATPGMVNYNSGGAQIDEATAIAIDASKAIYVAGYQQTNGYDWAVRKYDVNGDLDTTWGEADSGMVTYNSGATQNDRAVAIAIDSLNAIYVAGWEYRSPVTNFDDWAIRKYVSSGDLSRPIPVGTSQVCAYVVLDVGSGASEGDLIDVEISNSCTDVTVSSGEVKPCTPVEIPGSTTRVTLISFRATGYDSEALLEWETGSEIDNLGFNVYRSTSEEGPYTRITSHAIPGLGSSPQGAVYTYRDEGLTNGVTYCYELEDIETSGKTTRHGPVTATPQAGAVEPEISSSPESRITFGQPELSRIQVLEPRPHEAVLVLETQGFYAIPREDGAVEIEIPGYDLTEEKGFPSLPVKRMWVEAIAGRKVHLVSVESLEEEWVGDLKPADAGAAVVEASRQGTVRAVQRRRGRARGRQPSLYPSTRARLVSVGFQGDVKKALVEMSPLRWDGASQRLVLTRRLVVRLAFQGREVGEKAQTRDSVRGRRYRKRASHESRHVVARLVTKEAGLYGVSFEEVFGQHRQQPVRANSLRLSRQGETVPFHLSLDSSWFHPGTILYFLSVGEDGNPYGHDAVYELETGIEGESMALRGASPNGAPTPYYWQTVAQEENRIYQPTLVGAPDRWLWSVLFAPALESYPFETSALSPSPESSRMSIYFQGASDNPANPDHHVRVYVNGSVVGEASWNGKEPQRIDAEIGAGLLHEGTNQLQVENVGDTEASYSMVMLDRFEVSYPRTLRAQDGQLMGSWTASGTAEVMGPGPGAAVLELGDWPVWLTGAETTESGLRFRAEAEQSYMVVSPSALRRLAELRRPLKSSLKKESNRADYLMIGPREFVEAAGAFLELRRTQGLHVKAVELEEIFSEFGFGEENPNAIKDFLSYAYHNWKVPPRYVVLLGDATYDFKGDLGTGTVNHVPALMVMTQYLETVSDPAYAAVNGDDLLPDLAIGRLPASTEGELQSMVAKILAWETSGRSPTSKAVLVTDNPDQAGDFVADADNLAETVLGATELQKIYLSRLGRTATRREIQAAFNDGASLMNYIGHGGIHLWADEKIFSSVDVQSLLPQEEQPIVLTMNCLNGYFHFPYFNALAEELMKADGKGAIAAFSPSGLSLNSAAHAYHQALLDELLRGGHSRLGDAVLAAQSTYAESGALPEMIVIYHLFGDPAMKIR